HDQNQNVQSRMRNAGTKGVQFHNGHVAVGRRQRQLMTMPNVQRMTDANSGGGLIDLIPQTFVRVDGLVVAVVGSKGAAPAPGPEGNAHCYHVWATTVGSSSVRIAGKPVIRTGDADSCGNTRVGGSSTTRVGG